MVLATVAVAVERRYSRADTWPCLDAGDNDDDGTTEGYNGENEEDGSDQRRTDAPTIARYICRLFYLHEEKDMLHLFDRGVDGMRTRGIEYSHIMKRDNELKKRIYK